MSEHFSTAPAGTEPAEIAGTSSDGPAGDGIAVDLTAFLLKAAITSPSASLTPSVDDDETATWYVADSNGSFMPSPELLAGAEIALLVRTPVRREPAWQVLLRNQLQIGGLTILPASSSGAILFDRTVSSGKEQYVAWCFGQGSRWLRRQATTPRFGLLAALNAMNDSAEPASSAGVGVVGASLAARDGNLRRANLTAAVPTTADAIPRIDTLADMLVAARINTGHEVLGRVAAGRSLQFSALVASVADFQRLSDLVVELAGQDGYRRSHGWIDHIVPETDDSVIEGVLERI